MIDRSKLKLVRERLEALNDAPDMPEDAASRLAELADATDRQRRDMEKLRGDLVRMEGERDKLQPDSAVLQEAERIERLAALKDRFDEAQQKLPDAEADLAAQRGRLDEAMQRIGAVDVSAAEDLLLPAPLARNLAELIREHERLNAGLMNAEEEAEDARAAAQDIAQALEALGPSADTSAIHQLRHDARMARGALDMSALEDAAAEARAKRDAAFAALKPWRGAGEDLRAVAPPSASQIEAWARALGENREARDRAERQRAEKACSAAELHAARAAIREQAGLPEDEDVRAAREEREARWHAHRAAISDGALKPIAETADAFERAMLADDEIQDKRARYSDDAARLRQLAADAAQAEAAAAQAEEARDAAQAQLQAMQAEIDAAIAPIGLPAGTPTDTLDDWIEARERALAAQGDVDKQEARLETALSNRETLHDRIAEALSAAGLTADGGLTFGVLVEMAEDFISQADTREARREEMQAQWKKAKARMEQRDRRAAQAREALGKWSERWREALGACWLGADGVARTPEEVGETLAALERVRETHERVRELERNIARWQEARESFLKLCRSLAAATGVAMDEASTGNTLKALRAKLDEARRLQGKREQSDQEIARLREALRELESDREETQAECASLCVRFGIPEGADLREMLERARARALAKREAGEIEERLRAAFDGQALDKIERELAGCDADELSVEAERLSAEIAGQDERVQEFYHTMKTAEKAVEAVGAGDAAADLAEQRRLVLLQLEEEARRYLRLTAGIATAEAALRLYRDKHRSSMMLRAAEAFRHITSGRFADLQSRPDKDGETLVAIKAAGGSLTVDQMSDGTRDQLYLALRMAAYQEFAETREPLPFIADDIMQTFD
ncbi:MAG: hypothetical protein GVX90_02135, partial [Alphaproteobacteria bacterium]|nr:hypothetical protein [Alphaproteobacteria bacterium]